MPLISESIPDPVITGNSLLNVRDLVKHFPVRKGAFGRSTQVVRAVDGVTFDIQPRETLGLAGESGCGKTTTGRLALGLIKPTRGAIHFRNSPNLADLSRSQLRPYRKKMQIIFQDPFSSLNPRMTVESTLSEPIRIHGTARGRSVRDRVVHLLESVGLDAAHLTRYPHEFSGGQRQRIGIARALTVEPDLIVCDEPVSALDVSIQAQIVNLLADLQEKMHLSYLFISHDLSIVEHLCDRVAIMYLGWIVEEAPRAELFSNPLHPYTQALLEAVPIPAPHEKKPRHLLQGDVPSPVNPPAGCRFHPRCPHAMAECQTTSPLLLQQGNGHRVACHLFSGQPASTETDPPPPASV